MVGRLSGRNTSTSSSLSFSDSGLRSKSDHVSHLPPIRRNNVLVGLAYGSLRPGGCGRSLLRCGAALDYRKTSTSIPFVSVRSLNTGHTLISVRIQRSKSRGNRICSASIGAFLPFLPFFFVCNLTGLLCCSAVAIASSGWPRPAVLAAHCDCRVARCVPWSRKSPFLQVHKPSVYDTHRLRSPSSPSRCKSDGFPGLCGLAYGLA